ncbi:hypothetical protein [Phyllobacterium sophorae]|uniref:Uncharacterized protein n=1 Tax=Phyllobacterium sophorae TaxID=1520277 RepID=A0A2P7B6U3_9HYPH|nr:hypothetical protein [Phyllobacterium sophorae]PSH62182.1 hypothetical protein CU103_20320 [Phyllobacterium sophorae]
MPARTAGTIINYKANNRAGLHVATTLADHLSLLGDLKSCRRGRPARSIAVLDGVAQLQSAVDVPAPQEKALTKARRRIRELEQKVGQQQLDLDFFKKPCGTSRKIITPLIKGVSDYLR